jgi:hypothetical protein
VDLPIALSVASCLTLVPSRNQRMTRTACLKQLSDRVSARVPRRSRSVWSRAETDSTVSSRTLSVAVYVALMWARNSCEVDLWKDHFIQGSRKTLMKLICDGITFMLGFCVFSLYRNSFGVSPNQRPVTYAERVSGAAFLPRQGCLRCHVGESAPNC